MYKYLGDRMTAPELKGQLCNAVKRADGKCIRGRNSNMLVQFADGRTVVVLARLLRKISTAPVIASVTLSVVEGQAKQSHPTFFSK